MAYDSNERMDAKQKEDRLGDSGIADNPSPRATIHYNPYTQVERFHGEQVEDVGSSRTSNEAKRHAELDDRTKYEMSAEVADPLPARTTSKPIAERNPEAKGTGIGLTALGLSILSLFVLPYLVAPAGIILGYMAFRRDNRTLGTWSMVIGAISMIGALIIYPYIAR